ncbi:DNA polymerase III subunit delta' [Vulcaniibacterium tengchongense]|uniref:DNA-directed DNA polymerase n=1 Tax=Vulcaniibacterium tengchongense TaxID=1273429 RepID=A0A3N4VN54_9GAMM|nr:DNA polymerase III subunit delta' [Vulcaniibacterium tengchongense]RPE81269.1 DNA polymerase III delta prime subunit [Vulcaniibacterium tengchongense]
MSPADHAFAPWQQRVYAQAAAALDAGRLAHGLLFCGPAQLGKRALAQRLARRVLCPQRGADGEPCGHCRSCQLFAAGTHPDFRTVSFVPNKEGTRLRTEIVIEQIRQLSEQLALTPQYGGAQVAIIDPADAINHAACNALLKTLEEPVPGRYLWLVSAHPARLPATIRSRCQRYELRLPPRAEALAWLQAQGHAPSVANEALDAARGHPGLAHEWLQGDGLALRREVAGDLARLGRGELAPVEAAQRWAGDDRAELRLRHAADLALQQAAGLTDPARTRSLAAWFERANRTRDLLRTTVRADLAVAELLLAWRALDGRAGDEGRKR